ncbi:MAG: AAA family ATPase [Deltaproteobacteria bacterium]|nr:MAG: AAA family ATPase [Deltaproteobacteria bacterium]
MAEEAAVRKPRVAENHILAVGGGKGGTGKSLIAVSIGICLANRGNEVLLIDADLGTANLHTFLGLEPPQIGLSDFLAKKKTGIDGVIIKTGISNLKLISGAKDIIGMANLAYGQKVRILSNIKKLNYRYILIDLGPGTSFNTLDFFLISHCGILITSPEPTSIENTYRFTRSLLFRYLRTMVSQKVVRSLIDKGVMQRNGHKFYTVFDLLQAIERIEPELGDTIANHLSSLDIKLIVNQARTTRDRAIGQKMAMAARKYLGIPIDFLGNVSYDNDIRKGLLERKSLMAYFPYSKAFEEIIEISQKMLPTYQLGLNFFTH